MQHSYKTTEQTHSSPANRAKAEKIIFQHQRNVST